MMIRQISAILLSLSALSLLNGCALNGENNSPGGAAGSAIRELGNVSAPAEN